MGKIITFLRYSVDFVKYGQFIYILSSIKYILTGKTTSKTRYYRSSLGKFLVRKGTLDFQFANYAYEFNVKKFVYKYLHDYDVFLDIGSNIGTYAIIPAKAGLKVYAWEPVRSNFEALKTNIELNNYQDKISIFPFALGEKNCNANFTFDPVNTGASHLTEYAEICEEIQNPEYQDIEVRVFDEQFSSLKIDPSAKVFMKVDVEGMEPNVLRGARKFIETHTDLLIIIEVIHSGEENIKGVLNEMGEFEYINIDDLNMAAIKIK